MYERVYRYDKPVKEVFLDILNYTNKTAFKASQLRIGEPVALSHTGTQVIVKPSDSTKWHGEVTVSYDRQDLGVVFSEVPLVIWSVDHAPESLLAALKEQFQVQFTLDEVEILLLETSLDQLIAVQRMSGFTSAAEEDDEPLLPLPTAQWQGNYLLKAKPTNLVWVGQTPLLVRQQVKFMDRNIQTTLAMNQYFQQTLESKVPVELVIDRQLDGTRHSKVLTTLKEPAIFKETTPFVKVAVELTGDTWVSRAEYLPFNLYGAKVVYNGRNTGHFSTGTVKYSHVLVVELSDQYCSNLKGSWVLHYSDSTAFRYTDHRVDRGPMLG